MQNVMDDSLRLRLEALNRGPLKSSTAATRRGAARADAAHAITPAAEENTVSTITRSIPHIFTTAKSQQRRAGLVRSGEVVETPLGPHWRVCLPLETLWQGGTNLVTARQQFLQEQLSAASHAMEPTLVVDAEFAAFIAALPDRTVALDLETCGLAGAALFLVGLLRRIESVPSVELLLARNYAEEAAVLASLWQIISGHDVLISFNGKSFDWPMVLERSVRHHVQAHGKTQQLMHIDILHHARRRWRKCLPDCRLLTLERHVCRRQRGDDIPGHAIPAVYADYVRTGFERDMDTVLHHNALDLVTLFDLALRLAA
jgi:uncharacterized protein YprB with RNaseH-like and TPR domain